MTVHAPSTGAPLGIALLLHGAGTDTSAAPYPYLADRLASAGVVAVRLDQPYRVAGRKAPDAARFLDAVVRDVAPSVRATAPGAGLVLIGRSSGARVACRVAVDLGARGVCCLGFPLRPPQGRSPEPKPDRAHELRDAGVPVLVVQGERDPFGMPSRIRGTTVRKVPGAAHVPTAGMADLACAWAVRTLGG